MYNIIIGLSVRRLEKQENKRKKKKKGGDNLDI
jgi:hypothetical protein